MASFSCLSTWKNYCCDYPGWSVFIELMSKVFWNLLWFGKDRKIKQLPMKFKFIILSCVFVCTFIYVVTNYWASYLIGILDRRSQWLIPPFFQKRIGRKALLWSIIEYRRAFLPILFWKKGGINHWLLLSKMPIK